MLDSVLNILGQCDWEKIQLVNCTSVVRKKRSFH